MFPSGTTVEVRVYDGTAYTRPVDFHLAGVAGGVVVLGAILLVGLIASARRR